MFKEIKITDKAIKQINHLLSQKDKGSFFRISIKGGGCSGFKYDFSIDKNSQKNDLRFENIIIANERRLFFYKRQAKVKLGLQLCHIRLIQ